MGSRAATALSENRHSQSNRSDLCEELLRTLRRLERALAADGQSEPVSVRSTGRSPRDWRVNDRLTDSEISMLVLRFRQGTPKHRLAEQYGISESSVKRILRKHREASA